MTTTISHPLYPVIRVCSACSWREKHGCIAPVPGVGPSQAKVMFVGEAPGEHEDAQGVPFTGQAGKLLDHLLAKIGLDRKSCYITNLVKCRPRNNQDPPEDQINQCARRWLDLEISMCNPQIIVALGRYSARYLLGIPDFTMERDHGIPQVKWFGDKPVLVLPVYHPAAGLHQPNLLRWVYEDFEALGKLLKGEGIKVAKDENQNPQYQEVTNEQQCRDLLSLPGFALDTETVPGPDGKPKLWSIQISNKQGTGWFIPNEIISRTFGPRPPSIHPHSQVYVHNYLYDAQFVNIPNPVDTMVMAYLLQLPLGLKILAYRLCGIDMREYDEYVLPHRRDKATRYLEIALRSLEIAMKDEEERFKPKPIEEEEWDLESCSMVMKSRKPNHIQRKIKAWIKKAQQEKDCDPYLGWKGIDAREKAELEKLIVGENSGVLGPMVDATLADIPRHEAVQYACRDADATWRIAPILEAKIKEMKLERVLNDLDLPMLPVALEMMQTGMMVDRKKLVALSAKCLTKMEEEAKEVAKTLGPLNPNSPVVVKAALERELGRRIKSTEDRELAKFKSACPAVPHIQSFRHHSKMRDSYADKLIPYLDEEGRVHPTIRVTGTETGRLRVSEPPLQAIPVRTELGREVRKAFITKPGHLLLSIDYSQIEMRVLAHVSQCKNLLAIFRRNGDVHTDMAATIFGITREAVMADQPKYRYPIKRLQFGVVYGITDRGLYEGMMEEGVEGWDIEACGKFINEYYKANPEIKLYTRAMIAEAKHNGYVRDPLFGRIRYIPEIGLPFQRMRAEGERQAANMPIAAAAQGIIKLATKEIKEWRADQYDDLGPDEEGISVGFLIQVHDELIWEVGEMESKRVAKELKETMEGIGPRLKLSVPLVAEASVGPSWGEMVKIK